MEKFLITFSSANRITGDILVTTSPRASCPSNCSLRGNGCYAEGGHLGHWLWPHLDRTSPNTSNRIRVYNFQQLLTVIRLMTPGTVWRHNQAGDLAHTRGTIGREKLEALVNANRGQRCFTFTHHDVSTNVENRNLVRYACERGFMINLSADSLQEADRLAELGIAPVACILPPDTRSNTGTPNGRKVIVFPARRVHGMTCATCQICTKPHKAIVGIPKL